VQSPPYLNFITTIHHLLRGVWLNQFGWIYCTRRWIWGDEVCL